MLLVQPEYYTQYPPLGLLKLSTFYRRSGCEVRFVRGRHILLDFYPDEVDITSLFTWAWKPVWECVQFYKALYPKAKVRLGGIYTSLLPHHAKQSGADEIFVGTGNDLDEVVPDYDLVPKWKANILFTTRGCIRKCAFCAVPAIEPQKTARKTLKDLIDPKLKKLILWDNNFFGSPNWREILAEIRELELTVDFNQGIDARLVFEEVAERLEGIKVNPIRMAYDSFSNGMRRAMERAIRLLSDAGFRRRKIVVYVLYNFTDSPEDFFFRVRDLLNWGVAAYPMRYEPLDSLEKNVYVAPNWTQGELEMVADARRVIGYGGAFPPYEGLIRKFNRAQDFVDAMELRPKKRSDTFDEVDLGSELIEMGRDHEFPTGSLVPTTA